MRSWHLASELREKEESVSTGPFPPAASGLPVRKSLNARSSTLSPLRPAPVSGKAPLRAGAGAQQCATPLRLDGLKMANTTPDPNHVPRTLIL